MKSSFSSGMVRMPQLVPKVGCRFHPSDEEIFTYYLKLKNQGQDNDDVRMIAVLEICKYEPWDLPDRSKLKSSDPVWYFFSRPDYKYRNSKRSNRTTREGYWKSTGKLRNFFDKSNKKQIGTKRTLVFYHGRQRGTRTCWVMHEYEYTPDSNSQLHDQGNFVLYKLKRKPDKKTNKGKPDQSTAVVASEFENQDPSTNSVHQQACYMTYDIEEQCLKEANATSIDETSHSIPSSFENPTFILGECTAPMVIPSDFELQSPHMEGGCLLTSNLENHMTTYGEGEYPPMVTPSDSNQTPYGKGDWFSDLDKQNQISPHMRGDSLPISCFENQISACGDGELSPSVKSFDFRSKSPYDIGDCLLTSDLEDPMSDINFKCLLTSPPRPSFDSEDKSTHEKDNCLKTSDLENPISDTEFEELKQNYPIPPLSCLEDQSTFYKDEPNSLLASDFRKVSSEDKASISVSEEGKSSSLKATPSDFANQNQFQKTDKQNLDDDCDFLEDVDVESVLKMLDLMENPAAEHNAPSTPNFRSPS